MPHEQGGESFQDAFYPQGLTQIGLGSLLNFMNRLVR